MRQSLQERLDDALELVESLRGCLRHVAMMAEGNLHSRDYVASSARSLARNVGAPGERAEPQPTQTGQAT